MDKLNLLKVDHTRSMPNFTVFIGTIEGIPAIYTLPKPYFNTSNLENILNQIENENEKVLIKTTIQPKLIFPASNEHVMKYITPLICKNETYQEYLENNDFLKTSWLDNIIKNKAENEKIYYNNDEFLIIADYKWNRESNDDLYLLLIFKDDKLRSLRDFDDVNVLKRAKSIIVKLISEYNIPESAICMYFHYRPSYFRAHIHILNISNSLRSFGIPTRNIFLDDAIKNLEIDTEYYKKDICIIDFE